MDKKDFQALLPWTNDELETLLKELVTMGAEVAKIDLKKDIELSTPEQKAELLKDITAIANTYDEKKYHDHGFLIYGAQRGNIVGTTTTPSDTDKFQNTIEALLRENISPMPQILVTNFKTKTGLNWGCIIILPGDMRPHMFCKNYSCKDPSKSRKKGEWFVRKGGTTEPGLPEDLTLITQIQREKSLEPLRESIRLLQSRVSKTEEQYDSALFKLVEIGVKSIKNQPETENKLIVDTTPQEEIKSQTKNQEAHLSRKDLPTRLKARLRTPKDEEIEDLLNEARILHDFITTSKDIPWMSQVNNKEKNKELIENIEEATSNLQRSIATIILNDKTGQYTQAVVDCVKILAKPFTIPDGTYTYASNSLRYYPLAIILYTIFITGVHANRDKVIRAVLEVPLRVKDRGSPPQPITNTFFNVYNAGVLFNDAYTQRWCSPVLERIRISTSNQIGDLMLDEPEVEYFFRGEFVLALSGLETRMKEQVDRRTPSEGLYLYHYEGANVIENFLRDQPVWFRTFYKYPLQEMLDMFDRNADKMANSSCMATGVHGLKTGQINQEFSQKQSVQD